MRIDKIKKELIPVGYWYSDQEPKLPMPTRADHFECKNEVVAYLNSGEVKDSWKGMSNCRLCDMWNNGSRCLTDGTYVWPEGLAHYIEEHNTPLPQDFINHVLENN